MKEFAVYAEGEGDNDRMDWFTNYSEAFEAAEKMADKLNEGEALYLSEVVDGDFESFPLMFKMKDGAVHQYKNGQLLWL